MHTRRQVTCGLLFAPFISLLPRPTVAESAKFTKPLRYLVPFAPAGSTDITARVIGEPLSRRLGQQVVIDNRPGAGGLIGTRAAVQSPPDGHTLVGVSFNYLIYPSLFAGLDFDIRNDLAPVTRVLIYPSVLSIPANSPYRSVADLVDDARKNPGKVTFASSGVGTAAHVAGELLKREANLQMSHVPYRGGSLANTDLMAGLVSMHFGAIGPAIELIRAGRLRALAVGTPERIAALPDVPTMRESGFSDFVINEFQGILAPSGTAPEVIRFLNQEIIAVLRSEDVKQKFDQQGAQVVASSAEEFRIFIDSESKKWMRVAKEAGIQPQ